ncbi:cytochrome b [Lacimicrobium alkaliphilum]|uniref:Cytochrome b n=1 Tax=Lacimicrobium alkaliphilum TaxID=1526571 RepID=A0ABQ1RH90_9ALTE|nr:cytochrome b/b6 domain-containing protein [Lacimicrobium alkaliphilum]GGD68139.1 cytochrome b [Lacimicrobium alkaliphilum]
MLIQDTQQGYGVVSRLFHWLMALALLWQCATVITRVALEDSSLDEFLWATHKPLGFLLMVLIALRIIWALISLSRRPASISVLAKYGHIALYLLMAAVPFLALLRQYGSGRAFEPFGLPLMSGFEGQKIEWMMAPGSLLHGWLGWLLFVMIAGHILMTIRHSRSEQEHVIKRMW